MDKQFYTYVLINSLDMMPIYIGKGCNNKKGFDRIYKHFWCIKNRKHYNKYLENKILKIGMQNIIVKKLYAESEQEAFDTEATWIKYVKQLGCSLCNLTEGGNGGWHHTEIAKRKISDSAKHRIFTKETINKMRKWIRTEEYKRKLSTAAKHRHKMTDETKNKIRMIMLGKKRGKYKKKITTKS
ncbi:MAG: hypothetical protein WC306_03365 [Candidatus Paceibacterota bacterium]|jgi:hypothetical protein